MARILLRRRMTGGGAPTPGVLWIGEIALDFVNRVIYGKNNEGSIVRFGSSDSGEVKMYAGASVPAGWLICDGSAVSRTTYPDLFNAIGTAWGAGDGFSTFNLPDLRGRVPMGTGAGPELSNRTLGQTLGAENVALTAGQSGMPAHTHTASASSTETSTPLFQPEPITSLGAVHGVRSTIPEGNISHGSHSHDITVSEAAAANAAQSHNNIQPSAVIHFLIKT